MPSPVVTLKWEKPVSIDEAIDDPGSITSGVYYITRQYGDKQTLYYIGKTAGSGVRGRLKQHAGSTVKNYRGKKMVSFARISKENCAGFDLKLLIDEVESLLIYSAEPEYNVQKKSTYRPKIEFILKNTGAKGTLSPSLSSVKTYEESINNPKKPKSVDRHRNDSLPGWMRL